MTRRQHPARWHARRAVAGALLCALMLLCSCSGGGGDVPATGAAFAPPSEVPMPIVDSNAPGIDVSHVKSGYVVVSAQSDSRLKFQVAKDEAVYNYDLPGDGAPTVYPINMGDGAYLFRIMQNTSGNDYVEIDRAETDVVLSDEFSPFTIPNMFCDYDEGSDCVAKARELTSGAENQGEALKLVCDYITQNVTYDNAKAQRLSTETGYVPDPDETLATGTGVCFDYASLGAAMLRSLGFPTKIITGYVSPGDLYHAWIMVYVDGSWKTGEFSVNPDTWSRMDLTFASSGETDFVGNGAEYVDRYVY